MRKIWFFGSLSILFFFSLLIFIHSCRAGAETKEPVIPGEKLDKLRTKIVETALSFEGAKLFSNVVINDRSFKLDCIGAVSAVFYSIGIDITKDFHKYQGNGVSRLFYTLQDRKMLYKGAFPLPGDIIFWDNTWDKNQNQLFGDDPLTHAGIIIKADPETGEVHYLHASYSRSKFARSVLNLYQPDVYKDEEGNILNDVLFSTTSRTTNEPQRLGGQLYRDSGYVTEDF